MLAGEVTAVEVNEARARELEENVGRLGAENVRVVHADGRELPRGAHATSTALSSTRPAPGSVSLRLGPISAGAPSRCPSSSSSSCRRPRSGCGRAARSSTPSAPINADESEAVVDASGLEVEPIEGWAQFRHPTRPEFLQTLPHVHRTSGFFIARLRVALRSSVAWRDWVRTVEIEPSLYAADFCAARRPDRAPPARRRPHLPLRHRRRALRPAGDDRPGRAALDRSADPRPRRPASTAT